MRGHNVMRVSPRRGGDLLPLSPKGYALPISLLKRFLTCSICLGVFLGLTACEEDVDEQSENQQVSVQHTNMAEAMKPETAPLDQLSKSVKKRSRKLMVFLDRSASMLNQPGMTEEITGEVIQIRRSFSATEHDSFLISVFDATDVIDVSVPYQANEDELKKILAAHLQIDPDNTGTGCEYMAKKALKIMRAEGSAYKIATLTITDGHCEAQDPNAAIKRETAITAETIQAIAKETDAGGHLAVWTHTASEKNADKFRTNVVDGKILSYTHDSEVMARDPLGITAVQNFFDGKLIIPGSKA